MAFDGGAGVRRLRAIALSGDSQPVQVAFWVSLALSLIALAGSGTLNRDGMLYASIAQVMLDEGVAQALAKFDWLLLPALMAGVSWLTGMSTELAGHVLGALFMAGTSALLVACAQRQFAGAGWAACLVVLSLPAINSFRDQIVREFGYWFFCALALWFALRWAQRWRWRDALLCQMAIVAAVCFRLEAVILFPALLLWQLFARAERPLLLRLAMLGAGPLMLAGALAGLDAMGLVSVETRLAYYLEAVDLTSKIGHFNAAADQVSAAVLNKISDGDAAAILFVGLVSIIPAKFVLLLGVFAIPLAYLCASGKLRAHLRAWSLMNWVFVIYVVVLVAFVTERFFLTSRYVSFLNLVAVPLIAASLVMLREYWPRATRVVVGLAMLTMGANVISLTPSKTHLVEAGQWLARTVPDVKRVGFEDQRVAYYAGAGYFPWLHFDRDEAGARLARGELDYVVVASAPEQPIEDAPWFGANALSVVQRFEQPSGAAVVVVQSAQRAALR
ncbi:MAG: hypothetical protein HYS20_00165 [Rhodocyclales bacterium]|nr:hypothetical protein [Rhodocyclales bacterium]